MGITMDCEPLTKEPAPCESPDRYVRYVSRASLRRVYTPFILAAAAENAPHSGVIWKLHVGRATVRSE